MWFKCRVATYKNMSSHHIVREKQEPALLILGLNKFTEEHLGQLLEWSPTVIATAPVAEQLAVYGIKIDQVVTNDANAITQSDVKIIAPGHQTALQAAFGYLLAQGYPAVNVVTDEMELAAYESYALQINLVIFYDGLKIYTIKSGFSKWKPANETVQILNSSATLQTRGLKQISAGHYQTITDGVFTLNFDEPQLFIAEEY
jgi:thiamine pyrophosphokinase